MCDVEVKNDRSTLRHCPFAPRSRLANHVVRVLKNPERTTGRVSRNLIGANFPNCRLTRPLPTTAKTLKPRHHLPHQQPPKRSNPDIIFLINNHHQNTQNPSSSSSSITACAVQFSVLKLLRIDCHGTTGNKNHQKAASPATMPSVTTRTTS